MHKAVLHMHANHIKRLNDGISNATLNRDVDTLCEDFYRKREPGLFGEAANLEEIIRKLESAPDDYPYKGSYDDLIIINEYSRSDNHAEIRDNPSEETSNEELKGFCQIVLNLTRGM